MFLVEPMNSSNEIVNQAASFNSTDPSSTDYQSFHASKSAVYHGQLAQSLDVAPNSTAATTTTATAGFHGLMPAELTPYSLSTLFGDDTNGVQNFQRFGQTAMTIQQHQHQQQQQLLLLHQQQQLQMQMHQEQSNQSQAHHAHQSLCTSDMLQTVLQQKMPLYDHSTLQRFLMTPAGTPQLQASEIATQFENVTASLFLPQGNPTNMRTMSRFNPNPQTFVLPSPHELSLRDDIRRMRGGVIEPFPEKLHRLLTEVEAAGQSDIISFISGGKAFAIHKPDKFFNDVVPRYFRQSRLSSFKRQLNLYGFELINTGPTRGGYYHEMFLKDRPELCRRMRRVAIKLQPKALAEVCPVVVANAAASDKKESGPIHRLPCADTGIRYTDDDSISHCQVFPRAG